MPDSRRSYGPSTKFWRDFGWCNLAQMRRSSCVWPASKILQTPSAKSTPLPELAEKFPLPWSAYVRLLSVRNPESRAFYETEALRSGWSIRQLDRQIGSQFYERIALSKNKAAMLEKAETAVAGDIVTPEEAIKDPFVLEFLGLKDVPGLPTSHYRSVLGEVASAIMHSLSGPLGVELPCFGGNRGRTFP